MGISLRDELAGQKADALAMKLGQTEPGAPAGSAGFLESRMWMVWGQGDTSMHCPPPASL